MRKRFLTVIFTTFLLLSLTITSFAASATRYAYAVGTNFGTSGTNTGDFTVNVNNARDCYSGMRNVVATAITIPTASNLAGNNNGGYPKLASDIVFLNSHACAQFMLFDYKNYSGTYKTGIYDSLVGRCPDGYTMVDIQTLDWSKCDIITFAGCETASAGIDNITYAAYMEGATSAVGFNESIHSRTSSGVKWLQTYNDYLSNGYTVNESVAAATAASPSSDLGNSVKVYGGTNTASLTDDKITDTYRSAYYHVNRDQEFSETLLEEVSLKSNNLNSPVKASQLESLIKEFDASADLSNCDIRLNLFDDENGLIKITYKLGDNIETDMAYVLLIEGKQVTGIFGEPYGKAYSELKNRYEITMQNAASYFSAERETRDYDNASYSVVESDDFSEECTLTATKTGYRFSTKDYKMVYYEEQTYYCQTTGVYCADYFEWDIEYGEAR